MPESVVSLGVIKWLFSNSIISSTFILNSIKRKIVHQQRKLELVVWAMFWMFVSPPNHVPSLMVFGIVSFEKLFDHEGETLIIALLLIYEEVRELALCSPPHEATRRWPSANQEMDLPRSADLRHHRVQICKK